MSLFSHNQCRWFCSSVFVVDLFGTCLVQVNVPLTQVHYSQWKVTVVADQGGFLFFFIFLFLSLSLFLPIFLLLNNIWPDASYVGQQTMVHYNIITYIQTTHVSLCECKCPKFEALFWIVYIFFCRCSYGRSRQNQLKIELVSSFVYWTNTHKSI